MLRLLFLILFFITPWAQAQIMQDAQAKNTIIAGLEDLYAYDFKSANEHFTLIRNKYPKHPAAYLLFSMQAQQQFFPLKDFPSASKNYVTNLEKAYSMALTLFEKNENDLEAAFFCSASLGFLAAYEADNQNFFKAVNYAQKAYSFLKIGLKNTDRQPEFLYASGIYNYYRISYPELHPIIKPFMYFFQDGNKKAGLNFLELGTHKTIFVKNESLFYLGYILNKYEGAPAKGLLNSAELVKKYPENHWYTLQRAELLSLTANYDAAEEFIEKLEKTKSPYYLGCALTFRGMREEFQNRNLTAAESFYTKSLMYPWEERFTKDVRGLSYLGLVRIAQKNGHADKSKKYIKLATEFIEYKNSLLELNRITREK